MLKKEDRSFCSNILKKVVLFVQRQRRLEAIPTNLQRFFQLSKFRREFRQKVGGSSKRRTFEGADFPDKFHKN